MKTTIQIEINSFDVPDRVRQRGTPELNERYYSLRELDEDTLSNLCYEFTKEVFKKAGKNMPPQSA